MTVSDTEQPARRFDAAQLQARGQADPVVDHHGGVSLVNELASRLAEVGLDGGQLLAGPLEALKAAQAVQREVRGAHRAAQVEVDRARKAFEAGELDLAGLHQVASLADALRDSRSVPARALRGKVAAAFGEAERGLSVLVADRVWPALVSRAEAIVAEVAETAGRLPRGVVGRDSAVRTGAGAAWAVLGGLGDQFEDVHRLRGWLVGQGLVHGDEWMSVRVLEAGDGWPLPMNMLRCLPLWTQMARPDKAPSDLFRRPTELRLATAISSGAGPGLYSGAQAREAFSEWRARVLKLGVKPRWGQSLSPRDQALHSLPRWQMGEDGVLPVPWQAHGAALAEQQGDVW